MSSHNQPSAATRKRRSSILKTKPRAPFAELEFNPPTPDGASKSRRVSFSRRTAVAEFVFNEGTTTWRNVYEKQNRSLESSNNESDVGGPPASNRSVHQQFHEVEAEMDCTTLANAAGSAAGGVRRNITLFNDMNFTEQLASLDCMTADNDLKAPTRNYEVSMMGESSKVFAESFGNPLVVEHTGRIEVDFSMIQPVDPRASEEIDDLSDIAKDVESSTPSLVGSFANEFNRSCYVEVDLNETKARTSPRDISDMSITDTVQSPNVLAISKNVEPAKKHSFDRIIDKENIVVQSFPKSNSDCFDRADENVLVFDGKKLKLANVNDKLDDILSEPTERKSCSRPKLDTTNGLLQLTEDILGCQPLAYERHFENVSQISLDRQNTNESNVQICSTENVTSHDARKNISHQMSAMTEMSLMGSCIENPTMNITNRVPGVHSFIEKSFSVAASTSINIQDFDDGLSDIIKSDVMNNADTKRGLNENERRAEYVRKTIFQPNVLKRKTIILNHDDDLPNFTLDVPPQFDQSALKGSQKGVVYDTEDSITSMLTAQAEVLREIQEASDLFKSTAIENKRSTNCNMSLAQAIPQNIEDEANKKRQTLVYDDANLSMTQVIPSKHTITQEKRQTIVFDKENENANMSMTQAISQNILDEVNKKRQTFVYDKENYDANLSMTQVIPSKHTVTQKKQQAIIFDKENDNANLSMTQAIPSIHTITQEKQQTIIFDKENDNANVSMTQVIPQNILDEVNKKRHTFNDNANMSMTEATPSKHIITQEKHHTIVFDKENDNANMSMTQAIPSKHIITQEKRQTIVFDKENDNANMSMTQAIPSKHIITQEKRQTIVFDKENYNANMSMTQAIPSKHIITQEKRQTIVFDKENADANMSMTQAIPSNHITTQVKRQTIVFDKENDNANMSITEAIPQNLLHEVKRKTIQMDENYYLPQLLMTPSIKPQTHTWRATLFEQMNDLSVVPTAMTNMRSTITLDKRDEVDMTITHAVKNNDFNQQKSSSSASGNNDGISMTLIPHKISDEKGEIIVSEHDKMAEISITQAIAQKAIDEKRKTFVFDKHNDMAEMSITQIIPQKASDEQKRKTIVDKHDDMTDLSITQAIPQKTNDERLKSFVFDKHNDMADMSITQAIPQKVSDEQKLKTIIFDKHDDIADMSITQAISQKVSDEQKCKTIVFDNHNDMADISITQAVPQKASDEQKCKTIVFDKHDDMADMSITQAIPQKASDEQKCKTIAFDNDDDMADMSITQAIPQKVSDEQKCKTIVFDNHNDMADISITQAVPQKASDEQKCKTIVFDKHDDMADMSITQAIPQKASDEQKCKTIAFDNDDDMADMSITQAIPQKASDEQKRKTNLFDKHDDMADMSIIQAIPQKASNEQKHKTNVFDNHDDMANMPITQAIPQKVLEKKHITIVFDKHDDMADMSSTQVIPHDLTSKEMQTNVIDQTDGTLKMGAVISDPQNDSEEKRKTVYESNDKAYVSTTKIASQNIVSGEKRKTITFETAHVIDTSKSQAIGSDSAQKLMKSMTIYTDVSKESMLCDSRVSKLVNVVSVEESQIKSTVYEEVPKEEGKGNQEEREKEHFLLLNRSIEQCIPKDIQLQINREMKLVQDASKAGSYADVKINKYTSANAKINQEQTSKRKTLLSQMVDLSNSENEQSFVDKTIDKTFGNVAADIALQKSQVENIETDIDISCDIVTEKMEANDDPGTSSVDNNKKDKSSAIGINKIIEKAWNDKVKLDKQSSQKMHANFLTETRHKGQTAIDINEDSESENTAKHHKGLKELDDTNVVLAMLTEATNEIESNLLNSANVRPTDSQKTLTKEYLDMMISGNPEDNHEEIDVDGDENDEAEDVSQRASEAVVKKRLTIAYLLDQSERIKSLNSTVNLMEKRSSSHISIEEKDTKQETGANVSHNISVEITSRNKSVQLSKEVVKTLNFEEDSFQDETTEEKEKMNISVAKKCNYHEDISIHKQNVSRVIPETMNGSMDKLNNLIRDLVKPNADSSVACIPEPDNSEKSNVNKSIVPRTAKQAKDIENVTADKDSSDNFEPAFSSTHRVSTAGKSNVCKTYPSDDSIRSLEKIFDIDNPLNNINLRYVTKVEKTVAERKFDAFNPVNNICLNVEMLNPKWSLDNTITDRSRTKTVQSRTLSKVASVDKETETIRKVIENKEVNTVIAMKNNEELLDNTSCITLVDDSMDVSSSKSQKSVGTVNSDSLKFSNKTVDVLYMVGIERKDVESNRKRSLSPRRDDQQQNRSTKNFDLTPNPPRKIHKLSSCPALLSDISILQDYPHIAEQNSAITRSLVLAGDTTDSDTVEKSINVPISNHTVPEKSDITKEKVLSTRRPALARDTSENNRSVPLKPEFEAGNKCPEVSDMQIGNLEVKYSDNDKQTEQESPQNVDLCESRLRMETSADLSMKEENLRRYQESMSFVEECKIDLISQIENLPFMGTWCCEWDYRDSDWSFLLLHGTVRMCIRFELSDGTCVHADTPVRSVEVQALGSDDRRSITSHCIAACVTALRSLATVGACARARDASALLSRCARAVHDAARWAREMQHASVHLAYDLSGSILTLQVANVPLRSVWEVSLRIVDGEDGPRATGVSVRPVCARAPVPPEEVSLALRDVEPGWRHVPLTVQKIFKHLKHKTKADPMMAF